MENSKVTFFCKESVIFPYVNFETKGDKLILNNGDYTDIIVYIEKMGLNHV